MLVQIADLPYNSMSGNVQFAKLEQRIYGLWPRDENAQ